MASEAQELQERISRLQGQIHQRRSGEVANLPVHQRSAYPYPGANRGSAVQPTYRGRGYTRGGPYRGVTRGRGNTPQFRNRVLVLNGTPAPDPTVDVSDDSGTTTPNGAWVAKVDRHKQLINASVYEKITQERLTAIEATRQEKLKQKDELEKARLQKHLQHQMDYKHRSLQVSSLAHNIDVHGIQFNVMKGGSKLVRVPGDINAGKQTPKTAIIAGVTFRRSKNGNLYRATVIKSQRKNTGMRKINKPCKVFSNTGTCAKGQICPFIHDDKKVAACKELLFHQSCPSGPSCNLSHELTPERTPHCLHFARGGCTKEDCVFAHVHVSPTAPVCSNFPVYGYCELGATCSDKHIFECPDFSNTGTCTNAHCKLPHIHKAANMRRQVEVKAENSDISSDEDDQMFDSDDFDSDEAEEFFRTKDGNVDTDFANQRDFVQM